MYILCRGMLTYRRRKSGTDCQEKIDSWVRCKCTPRGLGQHRYKLQGEDLLDNLVTPDLDVVNVGNTPEFRGVRRSGEYERIFPIGS